MKALLLARVSSKEQEEGQSIPAQERRLRESLPDTSKKFMNRKINSMKKA